MIQNWIKFNESNKDFFTYDMAQEIVYYFSEDSKPSKGISDKFFSNTEVNDLFSFYESGYKEYKDATRKLLQEVNQGSLDFRDNMIQVYNMIRDERSVFPTISEIEDNFLDLIDKGYSFIVYSSMYEYRIKIHKYDDSVENFVKHTKSISDICQRLNVNPVKCTLSKAERLNGFYNQIEKGKDKYEVNEFEIQLRRSGWKKSSRDNTWSTEE